MLLSDENDDEYPEEELKRCVFLTNDGFKCNRLIIGSANYCITHLKQPCAICGTQATHVCSQNRNCPVVLCDSRYCIAMHNSTKHVNLNYMGFK